MERKHTDIQQLIGNALRWGVTVAYVIGFVGLVVYLFQHGGEAAKDYAVFDASHPAYTHLDDILAGVLSFQSFGIIQLGVIVLILTPIMRVVLSLFDFVLERDWLYAFISAVVLAIILCNSLGGKV